MLKQKIAARKKTANRLTAHQLSHLHNHQDSQVYHHQSSHHYNLQSYPRDNHLSNQLSSHLFNRISHLPDSRQFNQRLNHPINLSYFPLCNHLYNQANDPRVIHLLSRHANPSYIPRKNLRSNLVLNPFSYRHFSQHVSHQLNRHSFPLMILVNNPAFGPVFNQGFNRLLSHLVLPLHNPTRSLHPNLLINPPFSLLFNHF